MTWSRDGSGLLVKRHRGMTLPQWSLFGIVRENADAGDPRSSREVRRTCRGANANVDTARDFRRSERRDRLSRRAKRRAKAAARRTITIMLREQSKPGANRLRRRRVERAWLERVAPDLYGVVPMRGEPSKSIRLRCRLAMTIRPSPPINPERLDP
jgi:hypothetical protein